MNPQRLITLDGVLTVRSSDGAPDDYNNPTETTTTRDVKCWYEQAQASEATANTLRQDETHRLFLLASESMTGWDQLAVNGLEFEVVGPPWKAINPRTGVASHIEARGRQVI
jgi:hypothetical protein